MKPTQEDSAYTIQKILLEIQNAYFENITFLS